jgi:hypothetical protein
MDRQINKLKRSYLVGNFFRIAVLISQLFSISNQSNLILISFEPETNVCLVFIDILIMPSF